MAMAVLTALIFGTVPALRAGGVDPNEALKTGDAASSATTA
jgi:ABC-type antimicrobial peptide transport system permease subunit